MAKRAAIVNVETGRVIEINMIWEPPVGCIAVQSEDAQIGDFYERDPNGVGGAIVMGPERKAAEEAGLRAKEEAVAAKSAEIARVAEEQAAVLAAKNKVLESLQTKRQVLLEQVERMKADSLTAEQTALLIVLENGLSDIDAKITLLGG